MSEPNEDDPMFGDNVASDSSESDSTRSYFGGADCHCPTVSVAESLVGPVYMGARRLLKNECRRSSLLPSGGAHQLPQLSWACPTLDAREGIRVWDRSPVLVI